jgi:hypothetical protein
MSDREPGYVYCDECRAWYPPDSAHAAAYGLEATTSAPEAPTATLCPCAACARRSAEIALESKYADVRRVIGDIRAYYASLPPVPTPRLTLRQRISDWLLGTTNRKARP